MEEGDTSASQEETDVNVGVEKSPREKCCYDALIYISLLSNGLNIGLNIGLLGPSLPDLALQTGSTIPEMSVVFITSSVAYMVGSLMCGLLLGRLDGHLVISFTLILQALSTAIAPWCRNLAAMSAFISLAYFFSTVVIAGTAYLCFRLERSKARVMTQSAFLLFNLGKALVPFIVAPFLTQTNPDSSPPSRKQNLIKYNFTGSNPDSWFYHIRPKLEQAPDKTSAIITKESFPSAIGYGYGIVAIFSLLMSVLYGIIFVKKGCHFWASPQERRENLAATASIAVPTSSARKYVTIGLFFFMIFLQCGMESVDAGLLMTFLTEYLGRGKDMGVVANALYQGTKVIACILVVLTVKYVFPSVLLFIDLIFMLISTSLMCISIGYKVDDALLWVTFILLAIGMSNSYATLASWLETRFPMTGKITSILTISFGLGSMVMPTLTTMLLDSRGPIMFPLVLLGSSIICFITYIITKLVVQEGCCPKPDLQAAPVTEYYVQGDKTESDKDELLPNNDLDEKDTSDPPPTERTALRTKFKRRPPKQKSLSELSPDQCFHAYHSKFITDPTAPPSSRRN